MDSMHVVTLEILRHGPPHNQLLSPLTNYLALCGNHPAVSLQIPFEHNQLKLRLRPIAYKDSAATMQLQLDDISNSLGNVLSSIPGLIADAVSRPERRTQLTHFRLILSASELALLPFELAKAPNGFPGAGQPLLLQSDMPICMTREIRRVKKKKLQWPKAAPRILFLAAQPEGAGPIPLESHLSVLRRAIEPWMRYYDENDREKYVEAVNKHLVLLPQANIDQIAEVCKDQRFTHVHILAHGAEYKRAETTHFGLALHDPRDPSRKSIVDGAQLANVLRGAGGDEDEVSPAVVTLATCDSGNVGSVEGIGASVAHALHEAGIPLVVASQFPLSFDGSVLMAQVLYEDLLWGKDPRPVLSELRRQLQARVPHSHDWASLVVYASFPEDFETQLPWVQLKIASASINAAMSVADVALPDGASPQPDLLKKANEKIEIAKKRVAAVTGDASSVTEIRGLLASTEKRQGQLLYAEGRASVTADRHVPGIDDIRKHLERASGHYWMGFQASRSASWPLVQYIALKGALDGVDTVAPELWYSAKMSAESDLDGTGPRELTWAHGSLMELFLLASAMTCIHGRFPTEYCAEQARIHARAVVDLRVGDEIYTTRRQLQRYTSFFYELLAKRRNLPWPVDLAKNLLDVFPAGINYVS